MRIAVWTLTGSRICQLKCLQRRFKWSLHSSPTHCLSIYQSRYQSFNSLSQKLAYSFFYHFFVWLRTRGVYQLCLGRIASCEDEKGISWLCDACKEYNVDKRVRGSNVIFSVTCQQLGRISSGVEGKGTENVGEENQDLKKNINLQGTLYTPVKDTNTFNGIVIKYSEPPEARKPKRRWRFYVFKVNILAGATYKLVRHV